ncbi:GDP-mannose 4,6-dehydratase [Azotobacter beijerinckii]|uniref:GDP-mannose 4,6-dehydratase n=1 Tax=Azotobacter beijerinckii TaxID=170623 RepID=A0A1I3ZVZ3_9GAMM|nr:GDP-mannose 4,6-dehydratase [Azotobacter beijerinckii]MDV7209618.1 GDP-mannose 4,6-dehydratase [Azotobacter beijerinckii]SFA85294.1 GDP-mannose 4,6-dehydratase [Azotobacter beijerinckii]SFK47816.1 GDP-mannose 4,6-dehydratase [Azotobacter beijerinckii]
MNHVLLTGANGFVGKVLRTKLCGAGYRVTCTVSSEPLLRDGVEHVRLDIRDAAEVEQVVQQLQPTHVVHLAAISHVPTSFRDPLLTWQTNVMGSLNLLEAVKRHVPEAFVLFASSSEVYGEAFKVGEPLDEGSACQPMNPYAASKLAAELAFVQYFRQGLRGVVARPFNHIGPGQSPDFVTASFAKQIAEIERGLQPPVLQVGNLEACRDFLDVRDVCDAYVKLLDLADRPADQRIFNIASGQARKIRELLDELLAQSPVSIAVEQDPQRLRPSDIPFAVGDCRRLQASTGWQPAHALGETLGALLNDWREKAATVR